MNNKVKDYLKSLEQTREKIRIEEKIIDIEKQDFEETLMRQREKFYKELEKKEQSVNEKLKEVQSIEDNLNELLEIKIGNFLKSLRGRTNLSNERLEISLETIPIQSDSIYTLDKLIDAQNKNGNITFILTVSNNGTRRPKEEWVYFKKRVKLPLDYKLSNGTLVKDNLKIEKSWKKNNDRKLVLNSKLKFTGNINELPIKFNINELDRKTITSQTWAPFGVIRDCVLSCAERENTRNKPTM